MPGFDNYPYTNFHELNLDYFMNEFKRIFDEWDELYETMTGWKDATDAELAAWKTSTLADMNAWETALLASLDAWKTATGADISDWEAGVLSDLSDWKDTFTAYAASITVDAEAARDAAAASAAAASGSATAAAGSATAAAGSATNAAASALSVSSEIDNIEQNSNAIKSILAENFNLFNGHITEGYQYRISTGELVEASDYKVTDLIPVTYSNYNKRLRTNVQFHAVAKFNENKEFITSQSGRYDLTLSGVSYVAFTFDILADTSELMIAYTDYEESGTVNLWNTLYPAVGYVPYKNNVDQYKIADSRFFIQKMKDVTGASLIYDEYSGEQVIHIAGRGNPWISIDFDVTPCKAYILEFNGKANYTAYSNDLSRGTFFVIEFLDGAGNKIGNKYNSYVLGDTRRGYHRYGAVSPFGCRKMQLRLVTRGADDEAWISNVTMKEESSFNYNRSGFNLHGHQGSIFWAPKNTIPAFQLAKLAGFSTVVTNINVTYDGVLVALHDNTIDATSDGTGNVRDYTFTELQAFDFGSWFNTIYTGTKIPKFEDVIKTLGASGIRPGLSIHDNLSEAELTEMCNILIKYGFGKNCLIKAFDVEDLTFVHTILGDAPGLEYYQDVTTMSTARIDAAATAGFYGIEFNVSNYDQTLVTYAQENDVKLSYYIANDPAKMKEMYKAGICSGCTDTFNDIVFPMD